ncbi:ABC transporter substrate-binding protein [Paenibacillus allorhizosphaerae]|uniref:Aliphatic sulfonates-binding protein n=1 Tax=Paenibacillus allorhizosphaerae TaxID=2849866 RepID=A0ABM8VK63_9BACL|nr:ABC transporter substrate-binding protein [Paenibacillus allorhizosphaerae]CAG7646316.1 Putative aliphatic sulfonates-binding protein [Paenibacillus allorhizosphaerae]
MKKVSLLALTAVLCVSTALAGCGKKEEAAPQNAGSPAKAEAASMDIGMLKLTSSAPLFIGIEKGFFKEENIDAKPKWFDAAQPIAVATAGGSVDIGATGITASLYNMVAGGQKLVIVADKGREQKGYSSTALMVPKDSPVKSIAELKGKKIGITQTGSTYHYMTGRLLEKHGLTLKDIELVPLNSIKGLMESLKSKQVDAVMLNEPNITAVLKEGYGRVISQVGDEIEYQTSGLFFSPKLAGNKDLAVRFLKAYAKATRYYYDAVLVQKDGKIVPGANYDEVVKIIAKYTDQPEENVKQGLPYMDRDGKLLASDIKTQVDWYAKEKLIDKAIDTKGIVNTELLDEALKQLGK